MRLRASYRSILQPTVRPHVTFREPFHRFQGNFVRVLWNLRNCFGQHFAPYLTDTAPGVLGYSFVPQLAVHAVGTAPSPGVLEADVKDSGCCCTALPGGSAQLRSTSLRREDFLTPFPLLSAQRGPKIFPVFL
jgi:hypothetical protein